MSCFYVSEPLQVLSAIMGNSLVLELLESVSDVECFSLMTSKELFIPPGQTLTAGKGYGPSGYGKGGLAGCPGCH